MEPQFLIQTIDGQVRHDFSFTLLESIRYHNWLDRTMSYETTDVIVPEKHEGFIPVGSVEFVSDYMKQFFGLTPTPKNVPEELFGYAGREIFNASSDGIKREMQSRGLEEVFVKSNDEIKSFSGVANTDTKSIPNGNHQVSSLLDIASEYRCFIFKKI